MGSLNQSTWSLIDAAAPAKGLVLSYGGGQGGDSAVLTLACDKTTDGLDVGPTFLGTRKNPGVFHRGDTFNFAWNTSYACPL